MFLWHGPAGVCRAPAYRLLDAQRLGILAARPITQATDLPPGTIVASSKDEILVACNASQLAVTVVQLPGKTPMPVGDVLNSRPDFFSAGKVFTHAEVGGK